MNFKLFFRQLKNLQDEFVPLYAVSVYNPRVRSSYRYSKLCSRFPTGDFPTKKSNHPVCVHYGRNRAFVTLRNCDTGVLKGTDHYEYLEADDCKCQQCSSSDTSCEGLRYRPHRSHPDAIGFRFHYKK
ncbi:hypothetical protein NQ318_016699 [Aromia moschata]|uniref:Uncharacterized protein n=1 Tax=Aromia moschata TaxID=1265417 RepID=A0AAV8XNR9_9CUCU|nr:hypothetical protein NQ318_016699 [Aromia moschata]